MPIANPAATPVSAPAAVISRLSSTHRPPHLPARGAERSQHPDLSRALDHRHRERVHDAEQTDDHRDRHDRVEHVEGGGDLPVDLGLLVGHGRDLEAGGVALDKCVDPPLERCAVGAGPCSHGDLRVAGHPVDPAHRVQRDLHLVELTAADGCDDACHARVGAAPWALQMDAVADLEMRQLRVLRADDHAAAADGGQSHGPRAALHGVASISPYTSGSYATAMPCFCPLVMPGSSIHSARIGVTARVSGMAAIRATTRLRDPWSTAVFQRVSSCLHGEVAREALTQLVGHGAHEARRDRAVDDHDATGRSSARRRSPPCAAGSTAASRPRAGRRPGRARRSGHGEHAARPE